MSYYTSRTPQQRQLAPGTLPAVKGLSSRTPAEKERAQRADADSHARLRAASRQPENRECADCTARITGWAALPHGAILCINCAQIHRHIGRHISQVKAFNTGTYLWYEDEVLAVLCMGNGRVQQLYCGGGGGDGTGSSSSSSSGGSGSVPKKKPDKNATAAEKERYVREKYEQKKGIDRNFRYQSAPPFVRAATLPSPPSPPSPTTTAAAANATTITKSSCCRKSRGGNSSSGGSGCGSRKKHHCKMVTQKSMATPTPAFGAASAAAAAAAAAGSERGAPKNLMDDVIPLPLCGRKLTRPLVPTKINGINNSTSPPPPPSPSSLLPPSPSPTGMAFFAAYGVS